MLRTYSPLLLLALPPLAGCGGGPGDPYEPNWRYTARTDPIVLKAGNTHPTRPILDGGYDEYLATLPDRGGAILDPKALPDDTRRKLTEVLDDLFGTPAEPKVGVGDPAELAALALDADTLKAAGPNYKMRCGTCHGLTGDGRGVAGRYLFHPPRDFRTGQFKRVSGAGFATARPRFDDLLKVISLGVPGTLMVAFNPLSVEQRRGLVGAVIHLSVRGEVELALIRGLLDDDLTAADLPAEARKRTADVLRKWTAAQADGPPVPAIPERPDPPTAEHHESVRRGQKLFATAGCVSCHEGYSTRNVYRSDVWGLPNGVRNLGHPERHWGNDPADTARQVRFGIPAANMPAAVLTDDALIDLVSFVRDLPYPARLPPDVRSVVEK